MNSVLLNRESCRIICDVRQAPLVAVDDFVQRIVIIYRARYERIKYSPT